MIPLGPCCSVDPTGKERIDFSVKYFCTSGQQVLQDGIFDAFIDTLQVEDGMEYFDCKRMEVRVAHQGMDSDFICDYLCGWVKKILPTGASS